MHDPRAGRFFAVDPLASEYPHNSPYAFSENRVIDGVELEGLEYLNYNEARVEFTNGRLFLKLENFNDTFKNTFRKNNPVYGLGNNGALTKNVFLKYDSRKGSSLSRSLSKMNKHSQYTVKRSKVYNRGSNLEYGKDVIRPLNSNKGKGALLFAFLAYDIYSGIKEFVQTKADLKDKRLFAEQTVSRKVVNGFTGELVWSRTALIDEVFKDLNSALQDGLIDSENLGPRDMSDLANYILFGGNGDESKKIINLGKKIIREYSGQEAQDRLHFNELMDRLWTEHYKEMDNVKNKSDDEESTVEKK